MSERRARLLEVAGYFSRLGFTAFGGPAVHIAMMQDEVVARRAWVTQREFLDLVAASNMIPGPSSTELAIHLGRRRAGAAGLALAGVCFIVPAMLIVLGLAWAYDRYGTTREAGAIMEGVAPVVIAIVVHAIWKLGRTAIRDAMLAAACAIALALYFSGVNALILIFGTGLAIALARNVPSLRRPGARAIAPWLFPVPLLAAATHEVAVTYGRLFLTFLKIGAVLFGSGYVLLAFLRADFVENLGWLTNRQLLDAIAIGQVTPGPVFTTATFVGYLVLGVPGALVATLGIFLPSFAFVALTAPVLRRLRSSRWLGAGLDGVTVAAIALMIGVTWQLGLDAIVDVPTAAIAVLAGAAVFLWKPNTVWLVLAGGVAGLLLDALR